MISVIGVLLQIAATQGAVCDAAANRLMGFTIEEARGTRHERQIADSIAQKGRGAVVAAMAAGLTGDQCAYIMAAPDSAVRAMAIASLPERNGR